MSDAQAKAMTTAESAGGSAARDPMRGKKLAVARRLPPEVKCAVESAVREARSLTDVVISRIDQRFELRQKYAISRPGLTRFLRRLRNPDVPTAHRVAAQRRRQGSISVILNKTFGKFAKSNPELWERRAYLMLVGLLYERLATNEKEISTEELVSLSKMLAENRRVEARSRDGRADPASPGIGDEGLPEEFEDAVRRVYGTNLDEPDDEQGMSNVEAQRRSRRAGGENGMLNEGQ